MILASLAKLLIFWPALILIVVALFVLALASHKGRATSKWKEGCTCPYGPWGSTRQPDCPIHGRRSPGQ